MALAQSPPAVPSVQRNFQEGVAVIVDGRVRGRQLFGPDPFDRLLVASQNAAHQVGHSAVALDLMGTAGAAQLVLPGSVAAVNPMEAEVRGAYAKRTGAPGGGLCVQWAPIDVLPASEELYTGLLVAQLTAGRGLGLGIAAVPGSTMDDNAPAPNWTLRSDGKRGSSVPLHSVSPAMIAVTGDGAVWLGGRKVDGATLDIARPGDEVALILQVSAIGVEDLVRKIAVFVNEREVFSADWPFGDLVCGFIELPNVGCECRVG